MALRLTRRNMILAGGSALCGGFSAGGASLAQEAPQRLFLRKRTIEVNGKAATVLGIEGSNGFRGISGITGQRFNVEVANELDEDSLIHWHGLTPPVEMDGVPGMPRPALKPGESAGYNFPNFTAGTHWMHSHVGLQEQRLLAAPLIIHETEKPMFEQFEHVVMLHDFTFRAPEEILAELKAGRGGHAHHSMSGMTGMMNMPGMLNDVSFDAYLANDRTLADPEVLTVEGGTILRLRIINAAAASNMWISTGALTAELIAADGHTIQPVAGNLFPLAIAQRADLRIIIPKEGGAWPVLFQPEGVRQRTGLVLATTGADIAKISPEADAPPALDLAMEARLNAVAVLRQEPVTRVEVVRLTGGGADYVWGLNNQSGMHDTVFTVREGERVEVTLVNETTMAHPMHMHGHYFRVVAIDGQRFRGALRDTLLVPPGRSASIMFDAENPGTWAFHCHHAYHMNSGMMGTISYVNAA